MAFSRRSRPVTVAAIAAECATAARIGPRIFRHTAPGLWRLSADKIATIFGKRVSRRMHGKLATVIDQIEHGHHVFRAYFKSGFLKQYEKFRTFLRNELVSNNLTDFGLRKGLDHLDAVRTTFQRSPIASPACRPSGSTCMSIS